MSDLHEDLDREAKRIHQRGDELIAVHRRATGNRRGQRFLVGGMALIVGAGGFAIAATAFRDGGPEGVLPVGGPASSPTPTSDTSGRIIPVEVVPLVLLDAAHDPYLADYIRLYLGAESRVQDQPRYRIRDVERWARDPISAIFCDPMYEPYARRLERTLFPGAQILPGLPGLEAPVVIRVGTDFSRRHDVELGDFSLAVEFLKARAEGRGAERYLSPEGARNFAQGERGLSLYGYSSVDGGFGVVFIGPAPALETNIGVEILPPGEQRAVHETLYVSGTREERLIVAAERTR